MKKLVSIIILCLGCLGILGAQNVWKPISSNSPILGAASNGDLYAMGGYSGLLRSQDEGETWQVVLGYETGFSGYFNQHCFAVSPEGRICVFNDNQQTIVYSDDNGDTWQQTTSISSCAMPDKAGLCVPTNDIMVVWSTNGETYWTIDSGMTWSFESLELDEESQVGDMIVNAGGDVYVSTCSYSDGDVGIFHSTLSDMQNWEFVAAEGVNIKDMSFDSEGNVVACGWSTEGSIGFQHTPGFYLFDGTSLAIGDGGIVYTPQFMGLQAVLSYSTDHGEHFTEIGEHIPLVDIAPGGESGHLFKGADNHLYFDGGGEYWKSVRDADMLLSRFAPLGAEWYFHVWSQGPITQHPFYYLKSMVTGEEEVQGHMCSEIDGHIYVYEEDDIVYWYNQEMDAFTVLYDFNAEVGDSWICYVAEFPCLITVDSVGSVTWDGHTYRTQYVTGYIDDWSMPIMDGRIIEGIGYEKGLFPEGMIFDGPEFDYMRCYLVDGEMLYHEGDYDCDYIPNEPTNEFFPQGTEWYYEIKHVNGDITYQHLEYTADTTVNGRRTKILVETNTMYDKTDWVNREYIYEDGDLIYWWNKELQEFTLLYDFGAEEGDEWEIQVGEGYITVHVDAVQTVTFKNNTYKMLSVSDPDNQFTGDIICGIGHLTRFFPEPFVPLDKDYEIDGLRCFWQDGELVFDMGEEDCDAIYFGIHDVNENVEAMYVVYPNPTDGLIYVERVCSPSLQRQSEYRVTNLFGQTLMTGVLDGQAIDVSSLPNGLYFLRIKNFVTKFIVR